LAENESLKGDVDNKQNYLSRVWWWTIFRYFEKNVPENLPLKFGWPIPRFLLKLKVKDEQSKECQGTTSIGGIETLS